MDATPNADRPLSDIAARIAAVRARIAAACERADRAPSGVTLIGISKTHPAEAVAGAHAAGLLDFGENRVQEASAKIGELRAQHITPRWHLVGHLQTNKAAAAADLFDILHSVDSGRLADAIDRHATRHIGVMIEVNVAEEASKFGVSPDDAGRLAEHIASLPQLELLGLMTVAPQTPDAEAVRPVFRRLRELRDALGLRELSMGMTDDFEVAVEEGATMVRVGRAIFGPRVG